MTNGEIYQNFGGIDDLHARLVSLQKGMNDTLDRIRSQVAPLVETWDGSAKASYETTQLQWNQAQDGLNQVLHEINTVVAGGNNQMRDVEDANRRRFPG
ncbi:WXG100 family type VII secretion target [Rhodococcus chondri]|uniref:ESAT-6-like protein n=1 Tax=Rhodococcus chondri TaxID=3065941 RepID=A0ABU7JW53_9NOCA|nr:WXG100 family type VII secretion target [Rhodococcus sp. CC-R104]MEE2034230.1 WXG100 family type VII secretion target [Rhodococcus sp. CC-R104]